MLARTCARCGRMLTADNFVVSQQGDTVHQRCWRNGYPKPPSESDPLCPICLRPIKLSDMVTGRRDDLIHTGCGYTRS